MTASGQAVSSLWVASAGSASQPHPVYAYRVVIPGVGSSFLPGDADPLPETDFFITSRRRVHHPWIAQRGEGKTASADIQIGGQRLDQNIGHAVDGEIQIRLIDVPEPVPSAVCGASVVIPEGDAGFNLGASSFAAGPNQWHSHEELASDGVHDDFVPHGGHFVQILGGKPGFAGFILFGSDAYDGYIWRLFDGTEGGGSGFVAGQRYAFHCRVTWGLDTGPGNLYIETIGGPDPFASTPGATTNRTSFPDGTWDFWTVDPTLNTSVFNGYISAVADASGEIEFRFGAEGYGGSCNVAASLNDMEIVTCVDTLLPGDPAERYITGWLADSAARQQLLGRKAYLEQSLDGGTTWSSVVYAGYVQQLTLEQSLTFLLTLGDSGRGRRVSRAWAGLNPVEQFGP